MSRGVLILLPVLLLIAGAIAFGPALSASWHAERVRGNLPAVARALEKARLEFRRDYGRPPALPDLFEVGAVGPHTVAVLVAPMRAGELPVLTGGEGRILFGSAAITCDAPDELLRLGSLVLYPLAPPSSMVEWSLLLLPNEGCPDYLVVWTDTSAEWIPAEAFAEAFAERNRRRAGVSRLALSDPHTAPDRLAALESSLFASSNQ